MSKEIIDSHLIKVLHTLLTQSSVSRTATLLGQSQPTVSVALRKLREMTGEIEGAQNGTLPKLIEVTLAEALMLGLLKQGVRKYLAIFGHGSTDLVTFYRDLYGT